MEILLTICARGGSKGIPGKNIKLLNGKPLLFYTIKIAKQFREALEGVNIVLSTDSEEIEEVAAFYGITGGYRRPASLGEDSVGKIDVLKDVLIWSEKATGLTYDYVLDLDVTSPLRNLNDLMSGLKLIENDKTAVSLFSVSPPKRNPYFNIVEEKKNGYYAQVAKPRKGISTRQSAPRVFDLNASFYYYKREFFTNNYKGAITDKSLIYEVPHICFDLDEPLDFEILSFLMTNNKLDFEL
jgi:CMP-N-acetylneuraminic acid synthetase